MDDSGFEGDVVVDNISDAIEAIQAKLGTGASTAIANRVLRGTGTGATAFGQVATADITAGAIQQVGVTTGSNFDATTTSTSYVDLAVDEEMKVTLTTTNGVVYAWCFVVVKNSTAPATITIAFSVDDAAEVSETPVGITATGTPVVVGFATMASGLSNASHSFRMRWKTSGGTATAVAYARTLLAWEPKV